MEVVSLVERLAAVDVEACATPGEAAELIADVGRVRAWLDEFEARCVTRAGEVARHVLVVEGRRRSREASTVVARAEACSEMPRLGAALADGTVSAGHVDAVARAMGALQPTAQAALQELAPSLVEIAARSSVDDFERSCRDLARLLSDDEGLSRHESLRRQRKVKRWVDRATGMHKTLLELDPLADAAVGVALQAATADARAGLADPAVSWDHVQADALVGLITGARALDLRTPEVTVVVDLGSPETVVEKLEQVYDECGGFGQILVFGFDYSEDPEPWMTSLGLLQEQVLPKVQHLVPAKPEGALAATS